MGPRLLISAPCCCHPLPRTPPLMISSASNARRVRVQEWARTRTRTMATNRRLPRSMIPTSQKPAAVQKIDAVVEKAKTRVFWGGYGLIAGGAALAFTSYMLAGPQSLMDSASGQVKQDPLVARKLGVPLKTYGQGCECSRMGRSTVYVEEFKDNQLRPIARTTFYVEGPKGKGVVDARVLNRGLEHSFVRRAARFPVYTRLEVRFSDGSSHRIV